MPRPVGSTTAIADSPTSPVGSPIARPSSFAGDECVLANGSVASGTATAEHACAPRPMTTSRALPFLFATAALAAALAAQCPPGAPMPLDLGIDSTLPDVGAAATRRSLAKDALAARDYKTARQHLHAALEFHPSAVPLLADLALACADDADLAAIAVDRLVRGAHDAQGKLQLEAPVRKALAALPGGDAQLKAAQERHTLRLAAMAELARFVDKHKAAAKGNAARAVLVHWASALLLELGEGAPRALAAQAPAVAKVQEGLAADQELVYQGLAKLLTKKAPPPANGGAATGTDAAAAAATAAVVDEQRIRAARLLVGLRRQAGLKDLKGPPPRDVGRAADDAQKVLDERHTALLASAKIWSIDELEAMGASEREQFTQAHADWSTPGLALTPNARYRIETTCGHGTLLAAAKTVELHHARLVAHFGSDPFLQRQGVVRIVPESSDLEAEGLPFWWAVGFQGGDRTTVRFAWGEVPGLGRTLTHELTHRFDGVLKPFLGAWYGEGHAQWTAGHYAKMADAACVENHLQVWTVAHTYYKGYADRAAFERLLTGKLDDYRHNYFAGYSLYAFLRSYPPGAPRYREALAGYEKNARAGQKDPLAYFVASFCDGKHGRPATLDEFHVDWHEFLRGCYDWADDNKKGHEWIARYGELGKGDPGGLVMDAPTWSWARNRAEPFFGQDHAAAAALLLFEVGDHEAAAAAGVWSTTVDGWRPEVSAVVQQALLRSKANDAAAAFGVCRARRFAGQPTFADTLLAANAPKARALLAALAQHADASRGSGQPKAAATLAAEYGRLASLLAMPPLPAATPAAAPPPAAPRHLGGHGFTESSLTDYEDRRHAGLWYTTPDGDLHVGREKPRDATGTLDRAAHQRDAFAHSVAWLAPGEYVLRGRVHFTTSYASGDLVFGLVRRDRSVRLHFSSGDFRYAIGKTEQNQGKGRIHFRIGGQWERDGRLPVGSQGHHVEVPPEQAWFDYELRIRGPRVVVFVNGSELLRYGVPDGTPIEGQVGIAMGMGAVRWQLPTVQRLDGDALPVGLDLQRPTTAPLAELLHLPVRGVPAAADGTLVLWLPKVAEGSPADGLDRALPAAAKLLRTPHEFPQAWLLAVPKTLPAAERTEALAAIAELRPGPMLVVEHDVGAPFDGDEPWVLFVDDHGVLRAAAPTSGDGLHSLVRGWSRMFRSR